MTASSLGTLPKTSRRSSRAVLSSASYALPTAEHRRRVFPEPCTVGAHAYQVCLVPPGIPEGEIWEHERPETFSRGERVLVVGRRVAGVAGVRVDLHLDCLRADAKVEEDLRHRCAVDRIAGQPGVMERVHDAKEHVRLGNVRAPVR